MGSGERWIDGHQGREPQNELTQQQPPDWSPPGPVDCLDYRPWDYTLHRLPPGGWGQLWHWLSFSDSQQPEESPSSLCGPLYQWPFSAFSWLGLHGGVWLHGPLQGWHWTEPSHTQYCALVPTTHALSEGAFSPRSLGATWIPPWWCHGRECNGCCFCGIPQLGFKHLSSLNVEVGFFFLFYIP